VGGPSVRGSGPLVVAVAGTGSTLLRSIVLLINGGF